MPEKKTGKWLRISSAIASARKNSGLHAKSEELAGIFVRELAAGFEPACCSIFLIDEDGTNNLAEQGVSGSGRKAAYTADMPLMKQLALSLSSIALGSTRDNPLYQTYAIEDGAASLLCSPVLIADSVRGFIYLSSAQEGAFHADDVQLLELVAGEIAALMTIASLNAGVEALTIRDTLTGCFNAKKFREDIEIDIPCAERYGKPLSLLKIDIDFLKLYNDSNGRFRGDDILRKVGDTLAYSIRMCDKLYRYSGEEFILILPGIDKERAVFAASRLQKVLGQLRFEGEAESQPGGKITFSIGVASFPADAVYKDGLIKTVDAALRQAKEAGGDTVVSL